VIFKRAGVRYSKTPQPSTPYQAAGQVWDERIGSARVQARNWQRMALCSCLVSVALGCGLVWQSTRIKITPFIVEIDSQGEVKGVGPVTDHYQPTDAQIAHALERFIRDVRSIPIDPVVLRENWLEAYDFTTQRGAMSLNEFARANDPFANVGQTSIAIEVTSVVRASENSFQVRWIERKYANGAPSVTERWTAILTLVMTPPRDEARLRKNPLGVYVDGLNWTRELDGNSN
jgi:type IV secretion system protein VirB5